MRARFWTYARLSLSLDAPFAILSAMLLRRASWTWAADHRRVFIPVAWFLSRACRACFCAQVQLDNRLTRVDHQDVILADAPAVLRLEVDRFTACAQVLLLDEAARSSAYLRMRSRPARRRDLCDEHCPAKVPKSASAMLKRLQGAPRLSVTQRL